MNSHVRIVYALSALFAVASLGLLAEASYYAVWYKVIFANESIFAWSCADEDFRRAHQQTYVPAYPIMFCLANWAFLTFVVYLVRDMVSTRVVSEGLSVVP